jgi:peptidoglycan hydrolase-like protein with peptidoglycan-binding domain
MTMKTGILATLATVAFCVPVFAQQSSQISPRHLSTTEVRKIQQALDDKGFKSGRVDGSWGPETEAALKDFQRWAMLSPTGEVDPISITVLGLNVADFDLARARP